MSEEQPEPKPEVDISKAAEDLANEKLANEKATTEKERVSGLEAELAKYKEAEEAAKKAEEEKRKSELDKRVQELETQRIEDKKSYEEKLASLSTRQSSGKQADGKPALTREEYDANKDKYNEMLAKHILETGKL